ncbi:uncharacterized protein LOC132038115 [Lycium ferocissimum]|uniref:uncharacterized protein LOC132038115 n=1 Tax=Lycium ferocissimum TaxID=112874 RepID=UPI002814E22C|nr:uncharacterized protein LOC132038115 [Lycium ferocissimum]
MPPWIPAYFQEYENWLKKDLLLRHDKKRDKENHYRKNKELVDPEDADMSLKLGVTLVKDKNWFYLLSMEGKLWNDEHLDVIFYYLRKKGKYEDNSTYKFTTVSCILHTIITEIYHAWKNPNHPMSLVRNPMDCGVYCAFCRILEFSVKYSNDIDSKFHRRDMVHFLRLCLGKGKPTCGSA